MRKKKPRLTLAVINRVYKALLEDSNSGGCYIGKYRVVPDKNVPRGKLAKQIKSP